MIIIFLTWQSIAWANSEYSLYQSQGSRCGEKNDYIYSAQLNPPTHAQIN